MGYIKHHTIVVTGFIDKYVRLAHQKAKEIFDKEFSGHLNEEPYGKTLVSDIIYGLTNGQCSFFIAPDGSKEGWDTSEIGDNARRKFLDWLKTENSCDYVEVMFGGDNELQCIVRSRESDLT